MMFSSTFLQTFKANLKHHGFYVNGSLTGDFFSFCITTMPLSPFKKLTIIFNINLHPFHNQMSPVFSKVFLIAGLLKSDSLGGLHTASGYCIGIILKHVITFSRLE